jgi:hypothetical protein
VAHREPLIVALGQLLNIHRGIPVCQRGEVWRLIDHNKVIAFIYNKILEFDFHGYSESAQR